MKKEDLLKTFRIRAGLVKPLQDIAKKSGVTLNKVVNDGLASYLNKMEKPNARTSSSSRNTAGR